MISREWLLSCSIPAAVWLVLAQSLGHEVSPLGWVLASYYGVGAILLALTRGYRSRLLVGLALWLVPFLLITIPFMVSSVRESGDAGSR